MFVMFPWLTAFVIKDIAADRSDAGAEEATEAFDGGRGGVEEKVLGNMDEVETNWNASVVQKYFVEPRDLPDVTGCPLPEQTQCYCLL